jgi:hypothetical protein
MTDLDPEATLHPGFDTTAAHAARVYDYWLGGKDNFEADRKVAEAVIAARPTVVRDIRANREFLGRGGRGMVAGRAGRMHWEGNQGILDCAAGAWLSLFLW